MKKLFVLVGVCLIALSLTACKKEEPEVVGGWSEVDEALDDDVLEAFNLAMEGMTGASYKPIKLIGTQVVAGMNYKILCEQTLVTAEPVTSQKVVTIYKALDGTCSVLDITDYEE